MISQKVFLGGLPFVWLGKSDDGGLFEFIVKLLLCALLNNKGVVHNSVVRHWHVNK